MQTEGVTPLSRLDIKNPSRAQTVVDNLYRDVERRIAASPPGLCPVDMSLSFLQLCHAQSCGKCVPCRIGLGQLSKLIATVLDGTADMSTLAIIEKTARTVVNTADCAIGRDAARLVLEGFRDDYEEHILHHRCLAGLQLPVPCVALCPAGVDVPGYMALIGEGRCADAVRLIRKDNPFPVACAYICEHPCEARCRRNMIDDAINIRGLKRYAVDTAGDVPQPPCAPPTGKKVAIIGGGPSGLSCAYYLALMGHKVTVFEEREKLGGMLRYGIPSYRFPREKLEKLLTKYGYDAVFYPHFEVQRFLSAFHTEHPHVKIGALGQMDVQTLLMESALLITDFSSIQFDFAYMLKPEIYYQFDEARYWGTHHDRGYFDYRVDGFGEVVTTQEALLQAIETALASECAVTPEMQKHIRDTFGALDDHNCERNHQAIRELMS